MRAVVQRVKSASVSVDGAVVGQIGQGLLVLLGVGDGDGPADGAWMLEKLPNLRIFNDEAGKMNLSLLDVGGGALVVSQFTLYADTAKGRRPSYAGAAKPDKAKAHYDDFVAGLRGMGVHTEAGVFQAHMEVALVNDGPVTIVLDTGR